MVVAEVLTGIALVKQATDFIKSNIDTVKDIGEIGDTIENLFIGEEQCQHARAKKAGMGAGDQFGIKSVACHNNGTSGSYCTCLINSCYTRYNGT